ncbi:MAG: ASKHA domain-containing protein [Thermoproteota archaeon]
MPLVTIQPEGIRVQASNGSNLLTVLKEAGINIESVCGGRGVCKKCVVEVVSDGLTEPTSVEAEVRSLLKSFRLACQARIVGDVIVKVPQASRQTRGKILEWGLLKDFGFSPATRSVNIKIDVPSLIDQRSDSERLMQALNAKSIDSLLLKRLPGKLRESKWDLEAILHEDEVLDVRPRRDGDFYGVAVDVGTTTIVAYLVSLKTGRVISVKSDYNSQIAYGDDVISRMTYAMKRSENLTELQSKVVATINKLIQDAVDEAHCSLSDVYELAFAGNTVMTTLLYGAEVSAIATAPYVPPFRHSLRFKAREIGLKVNDSATGYTFPLISGYVGGDVVADILVSGMHKHDEKSLLIDLGTNGEVVLKAGDLMLASSTAAGPAIEGAGLSNGMRGMSGAIESVSINVETLDVYYRTIGETDPIGICGSGVVDAVAWMIIAGVLDHNGRIADLNNPRIVNANGNKAFILAVNNEGRRICITQSDIRSFQLAKAAIFTACLLLLRVARVSLSEISKVYIAGAFGNYIDPRSAMIVGMIPELPLSKIVQIGNGSGQGAVMRLLSREVGEEAELVARKVRSIDLNMIREFQNEFIDATQFPHKRTDMFPRVIDAISRKTPLLN